MSLPSKVFDSECEKFSQVLVVNGKHWKDYYGSAYSTRMRECIKNVREACAVMEKVLEEDDK